MRKILFIICWALAGVGLYSCSLDEPSYGKTTSDNYYQKESDIEQALTGAYLQLRTTWNEYALNHYFVGDCSTDDALKGGGNDGDRAEVRDLSDFTIYTTNGEVGRRWEILYRLINRCNDVIYYAPDAIGNEELLKRYANEAKALRAFGYYCLVTTFGEVPLITTPMQPAEILQIPRSPLEKVYECIVNDLTDASALPAKGDYSVGDAYRATRGFAKTMLAKTYMFKGDFTSAETVLHDIIEVDKDYTLLSDYGMNLVPTVVSNLTLVLAIKEIGSTMTSILGSMEPLTAVLVGVLHFGEKFGLDSASGLILIITAVIIVILQAKKKEHPQTLPHESIH